MPKSTSPRTYTELVSTFVDFLAVAVHTILYERHVYPAESFLSARKYNYPVRQSRHPQVCEWISDAVNAVEAELLKGSIDRVALVIFSDQDEPLERFMFDLSKFPVVPKQDWHVPFGQDHAPPLPVVDIEEQFRAVMSKLAFCRSSLTSLPEDCTFTIAIELKDSSDPPIGHPQPWVPVEPSLQKHVGTNDGEEKHGEHLGGVKTTPVRSIDAGEMTFEMWIEESKAKLDNFNSDHASRGNTSSIEA